jgi:hypothetical protein
MSYEEKVSPLLPTDPANFESKYEYANAYKEVGNTLFKDGKFEWAIQTYNDAVKALLEVGFEDQAAIFRDTKASTICCQCLSNAAMCSLKVQHIVAGSLSLPHSTSHVPFSHLSDGRARQGDLVVCPRTGVSVKGRR